MNINATEERQAVFVRWITAIAVAAMLSDIVSWQSIVMGLAGIAAYTGLLLWASRTDLLDVRRKRWVRLMACVADIVCISLCIMIGNSDVSNLYVIYVLPIVWAGYVACRWETIILVALGSIAGECIATFIGHRGADLGVLIALTRTPILVIILAGATAAAVFVFKRRDLALMRRDKKLSSLLEFGTKFSTGEDVARLMEQTLRAAIADADAGSGYIMLRDEESPFLLTEVAISVEDDKPFPTRRALGEGIEGYVAQTGKPLILAQEHDASSDAKTTLSYEGEAALCIPMIESGPNGLSNVIGVFSLFKYKSGSRFMNEDMDMVRTVVGLTSMAVVNSRLYESRKSSFLRALQALAITLEAKDSYTRGHSYRVSELCVMMAKQLHVASELMEDLKNGALLHDIGKIGIPDNVLCKPGRLTDEEFEIMKRHPVIGFEICKPLGLNDGILMLIRNHHEKLDGSGYPDGLRLGELPLLLRIICVADAFDAMSSSRPYRTSMDSRLRNEQLNRFAGTQFDPIVVEALKTLLFAGQLDELYKEQWITPAQQNNPVELKLEKAA